jgi:uncharacterized protein (DUF433 family)
METDLIHDRGRGPEIVGTRITVFNLLPHFLDPTATEDFICELYELTQEQVAAARAYVLNHPDTILAQHLQIEARMAEGNSPEVAARAERTHAAFLDFKQWLADRDQAEGNRSSADSQQDPGAQGSPTFREWISERKPRLVEGK